MRDATARRSARPVIAEDRWLGWMERHQRPLVWGGVVVLVALVSVAALFSYSLYEDHLERRAAAKFGEAFALYQGSAPGEPTEDRERLQQARAAFAQAAQLAPAGSSLGRLARIYEARAALAAGDASAAVEVLEPLREETAGDPLLELTVAATLARAYERAGRGEDAAALWRELGESDGAGADYALFELARLLERLGRREEAREAYRTLLDRFPQSRFALEARRAAGAG